MACIANAAVIVPAQSLSGRRLSSSSSGLKALPARSLIARTARRSAVVQTRATVGKESPDFEAIVEDLKEKWAAVDDKPQVLLYGGAAAATLWLSSTVVSAVNAVPVLPKLLELIGTGYTAWFVYRYLLFKSSRQELVAKVDELKAKVAGK